MKKILIANRGEIAIRIAKSAKDLGLKTVGIFSEDDADSLHISRMDESFQLKEKGVQAYLDIKDIVSIAKENQIDLIHPGYGFLSENPNFAKAVRLAGITYVGPDEKTLRLFGDKVLSKKLAEENQVPTIKGTSGKITYKEAESFYKSLSKKASLLLKAVNGGGGRGMRLVENLDDLKGAYERASSEAKASFGSESLFVEEYLTKQRHIEVQILGDGTGSVTHFGERECSVQRRHQKIIEMAPSPGLKPEYRNKIINAAVKLAESTNYKGLGTFEFLTSDTGKIFRFIEANARLQVEHTVTEQIYGIDLVKYQIQIALGKTLKQLKITQSNIPEPKGIAIQARINMEVMDKSGNTKPTGGVFGRFDLPFGPGVRVDTYGYTGYQTNPSFDSLIAKVITHGSEDSYQKALNRMNSALNDFYIEGITTNLDLLKSVINYPVMKKNKIHTGFLEEHLEEILKSKERKSKAKRKDQNLAGAQIDSEDPLAVLDHGKGLISADSQSENIVEMRIDDLPEGIEAIEAPMQGLMVSFNVKTGDKVWVGKTIAIMEAMKMEHELLSEVSGEVTEITVDEGDTVYEGHPLILIKTAAVEIPKTDQHEKLDLNFIRPDLQEAIDRKQAGHDINRPEAVAKRRKTGHRTARENIKDLCDKDSFIEYGSVVLAAQRRRRTEEDLIKNTTGDGMVCGLGHVNGDLFPEEDSRVMAMSYDYMVLAGTQGKQNHAKKDRMFEIAEQNRLPTILFAEGGGGRPGDTDTSGVAGLDCFAFTYFAQLSGLVPVLGITTGRCFAGNAVLLGCCDVIIATEDSNIGIGGPAMIEGGGLGIFTPEEVGPMDVQVPNGVVDIAVKDEKEAVATAKKYLSYFQGVKKEWKAPDKRKLRFAVPENRLRYYDMRKVIEGIADEDSILEIRRHWSPGMITSFIRVEGRPVGVVANNPGHLSGAIDSPGADKGSRFIQLCDAFDIPVLSLIDCPGIMVGPESEKSALVRHAARMFVVGANIETPLMSVVIRKAYGLGAQAMAGGSFKIPLFTVTWPTGEFGGMGLEGAVKLGFRKELESIKDPAERIKTYEKMVEDSYKRGKAVNMASHFELDDVIDPADTRKWIMAALKSLPPKTERKAKKRPNVDTW
ncbi:MAG: carboxyl transferase domain-containing protein [SAR86 cluster bacterium]|nr:carboxyl transferase domain-containing protein [SAR86 cluster bacterium]